MLVAIVKVAQSHDPYVIAGAFGISVGGYGYKKYINQASAMSPAPTTSQALPTEGAGASPLSVVGVGPGGQP